MRRRHARFVLILLIAIVVIALGPRVVVDPYRVFGLFALNQMNAEANTRYLKMEHWRTCRADSLIMGTSRSNFYPAAQADRVFGGRHYNFNVSGETLPGVDRRLRWLIEHCPIRQVLLTLDYDFFQLAGSYDSGDLLRAEHPLLTGRTRLDFLLPYLEVSWGTMRKVVRDQFRDAVYVFDLASGEVRTPSWDRAMAAGTHDKSPTGGPFCPRAVGYHRDIVAAHLDRLRDLAAWVRARGVVLRVVITPGSQKLTALFDPEGYAAWAAGVVEATGEAYQFGGFTPLNEDARHWYEVSHFNARIGTEILDRVARGGREGVLGRWTATESGELAAALRANFAAQAARCS